MDSGVIFIDLQSTYIEESVIVGVGCVVYPNVFLRGSIAIGVFTVLESNTFISDLIVGESVHIKVGSYIE